MVSGREEPIKKRIYEFISYEPMSGCWLWIGCTNGRGYGRIGSFGSMYYPHRVMWELTYGKIPNNLVIDHVCHNTYCINPEHLRLATRLQNNKNQVKPIDNISGFKGVYWLKNNKKWCARITSDHKSYHLGVFVSPEEAHAAYCEAARRLHGKFANYGEVS